MAFRNNVVYNKRKGFQMYVTGEPIALLSTSLLMCSDKSLPAWRGYQAHSGSDIRDQGKTYLLNPPDKVILNGACGYFTESPVVTYLRKG